MRIVERFTHRDRTVELRRDAGKDSVWIETPDQERFENRSDDVESVLKGAPRGYWQDAAKAIIDTEEGPEFTQTVTTETRGATNKADTTKGQGLISAFDEALKKYREKP